MSAAPRIYQVAVPTPLYRAFDYLATVSLVPGARVQVPFGRREMIGVVLGEVAQSELPASRLKAITQPLDAGAILPPPILALLRWAADYYHHPLGEVIHTALPVRLRKGRAPVVGGVKVWMLTHEGKAVDPQTLKRAPAQKHMLEALAAAAEGLNAEQLAKVSQRSAAALKALRSKGWVSSHQRDSPPVTNGNLPSAPELNPGQKSAVTAIVAKLDGFHPFLLHGVTGSGKTEVYLNVIEQVLAQGRQALVLVPEISLTPQLVVRFERRFRAPIAVLHSGLNEQERLSAWVRASAGRAPIVLGTRSAVFTPLKNTGVIVVDEEHDASYKQQDGFRYSARDVAVMRAAREKIPIILGSATPSLESLKNARQRTYTLIELPERTGSAVMPQVRLLDMRRLKPSEGLSLPLREALADRLKKGEQSILFLNRRGFSPVWMCFDCGWVAPCKRCDAQLTLHQKKQKLLCHHCGAEQEVAQRCPSCRGENLHPLGEGTERVEGALEKFFPQARIERIDRDSTARRGALEEKLRRVHEGEADILVGTQMLSKGHDFPNVTLVGILNADQGLYGTDFRSSERLFQLIMQVSGRAGRADKPGEVLIQTWHPDHPLFAALQRHDFHGFAEFALNERRETGYPPYSHLALLRAESPTPGAALEFLQEARTLAVRLSPGEGVQILQPMAAPMERRAGRYRAQLLVQSNQRAPLHEFLGQWVRQLAEAKFSKKVRWSLDVDPAEMY
ncbi:MAG: primosomal protein N' [Candidatus Muproteobacteria bacterium RIFCSPHIGHO2_12_FULL_60_33]|uniref:Replication restart protein PriA n=1 Tax=Candidatus Muproteobacteria bacterium RIFCSPLOWO2_01_FULL_60_18 TaxID=1817768 RepID=A0A1F6TWA2_9PROT|nr:MAG: primosomal protein N' [Candidatus Muproteobacteria bacterium RIFCSPLOWO2_01_FULL_60_18]OGI53573.1 MAG: primosomal protein N' [Candidatus Muproteobacteria bacterium RIFCSPHIGHO2_01_60_12]OGI54422.1 MAG: primosomal protein N' [Candidatus Muproteobacteria bacterium RIFCSPHIGHO2_12_FULL_60_33]OGI55931.1 MAG: primosomal protein N' [Candidatus Muproteobacteria bacterium RIFCSPHIGHO2_02_FULL_60_13]OGI60620.1 MAG: primosomal protein N' [Candidatus Muproteobacteria bacterium RIFCSPHIGHO2_01_FULL